MPGLSSFGLSRSNTVHVSSPTPTTSTRTKTPYWAASEVETASTATIVQAPAAVNIQRKPVPAQKAQASSPSLPPATQAIPRKPVAAPTSQKPAFSYKPVAGNPFNQKISQQQGIQTQAGAQRSFTSHVPVTRRRGSSPHYITSREFNTLGQPGVAEGCYSRLEAHNNRQPIERPLSPGSIFANGGTSPAPAAAPLHTAATKAISRGFGSVRRATESVVRSAFNNGPKISVPVAGSFQRGDDTGPASPMLQLVGLEVAQANVRKYGQADYELEATGVEKARVTSLEMLTGEVAPVVPKRKPAPTATGCSKGSKPAQPVPRQVVNNPDRETLFGDIIAAAQDEAWVQKSQMQLEAKATAKSQARVDSKGKAKLSSSRALTAHQQLPGNFSFSDMMPEALNVVKPANVNKTLPPTPASTRRPNPPAPRSMRRDSDTPSIKCSDCGKKLDAAAVREHRCQTTSRSQMSRAQTVKYASSREKLYAANFGMMDIPKGDEPELIMDTFVQEGHTVWRGQVKSEGGAAATHQAEIGTGLQGVRGARQAEAAEKAWVRNGWF